MKKILIAGTVAFDEVTTPMGYSGKRLGGSATYLSFAASFFSEQIGIVSVVGNDFPETYLDKFRDRHIDIRGLEISADEKTFYWKGYYYENMNKRDTLVTQVNALEGFNPVVPENFRDADLVVLGNLHPAVQMMVLDQLTRKPELVILDTMNFWMENSLPELKQVLKKADVLMVNEEEIRQLTGEYFIADAVKSVYAMGPEYVIVKQGEYGSLLFTPEGMFSAPAYPVEKVYDPTGAGDTFAGGFVGHLSRYENISVGEMKNAMICGAGMASFNVEGFGTERLEQITLDDIFYRIRNFVEMTRFPMQEEMKLKDER